MRVRSFCPRLLAIFLVSAVVCAEPIEIVPQYQDLGGLSQRVEQYLEEAFLQTSLEGSELEIRVGRLDPRLRLTHCDDYLTFELRDTGTQGGNLSVHTRCNSATPWSVYISAQVKILQQVWVANNHLAKGAVLRAEDFVQRQLDISSLPVAYGAELESMVGQALRSPVSQGSPVRINQLIAPTIIKRGDAVILEASSSGISVATAAVALEDASQGQQVRVRNEQSKQVIKAVAVAQGRVSAAF